MTVTIREARSGDLDFLVSMLLEAMNWNGEQRATTSSIRSDQKSWHYLDGWKRESDFGVIAVGEDGDPIGAAWARSFGAADPGYGFVSENIPEITMGVESDHRGRGAGHRLLTELIVMARGRELPGVSLSVEDHNDRARSLYVSHGFEVVGRVGNSDAMLARL
jgi:ribosomal protein S18 acetylase RimI-like enzyme